MKDAIGSSILIKIMLVFIAIYVSFLAVSVNYSQAFRVKNQIVSIVEFHEGITVEAQSEIMAFLSRVGYVGRSYDVREICTSRGPYYRITTYVSFNFPVVQTFFRFPIHGETRIMYNKDC